MSSFRGSTKTGSGYESASASAGWRRRRGSRGHIAHPVDQRLAPDRHVLKVLIRCRGFRVGLAGPGQTQPVVRLAVPPVAVPVVLPLPAIDIVRIGPDVAHRIGVSAV